MGSDNLPTEEGRVNFVVPVHLHERVVIDCIHYPITKIVHDGNGSSTLILGGKSKWM